MTVNFDFDRLTRTYQPGDEVKVKLSLKSSEAIKPKEVYCNVYCIRTIDIHGHNLSGFDSPVPRTQDNVMWCQSIPVPSVPPKMETGYGFDFKFKIPTDKKLPESVRGKYVSVDYYIEFLIKRGLLQSDIVGMRSFFIVFPPLEKIPVGKPVEVIMDRNSLKKNNKAPMVDFKAKINLASDVASFRHPPSGHIEMTENKRNEGVKQITVSYIRTEQLTTERGPQPPLVSEVCRMQIAENYPPMNVPFPFNLEWVRILICPDVSTPQYKISIGLKVRIIFTNGAVATQVIPLKLVRDLAY